MRHFSAAQRGSMTLLVPRANFSDQSNRQSATYRLQRTDCNVQIATYGVWHGTNMPTEVDAPFCTFACAPRSKVSLRRRMNCADPCNSTAMHGLVDRPSCLGSADPLCCAVLCCAAPPWANAARRRVEPINESRGSALSVALWLSCTAGYCGYRLSTAGWSRSSGKCLSFK